jgi:hypothetical protein
MNASTISDDPFAMREKALRRQLTDREFSHEVDNEPVTPGKLDRMRAK